ncbi:MAG: TIGR02452 family protein [Ruminococcus sp.]|nr:TIGR02452 family protein [Ruminococcus sp.]
MAKQENLSEEERLKQLAAKMRNAEYAGLSEEEIQQRERQKEMKKKQNIDELNDTLSILDSGCYKKGDRSIKLRYTKEQMQRAEVFLPGDIKALNDTARTGNVDNKLQASRCAFSCENSDALALAQKKYKALKENGEENPEILLLNLASATHPGGHTRQGASAQEEDLCRRTSLLLSLESEAATKYYKYNEALKTRMGSDGIILSPNVEVIKSTSKTLDTPFPVSVISCAAPMIRLGLEGMSQQEYEAMLLNRINGILLVAASCGYRHLILGAFGCGIYGNDAAEVSDLFARAIHSFSFNGKDSSQLFDSIQFAVLCRPGKDYNYREFYRNFGETAMRAEC